MVSETRIDISAQKNTCSICFDDDIQIFSMVLCGHWFCVECTKRHIETKLLEGRVPRCPHYGCKSNITLRSCAHLLAPKLRTIWLQKIKEESVPVKERVYCPNPSCSTLMSKTELSKFSFTKEARSMRCCFDCGEPFCINCKVPWHSNLSCKDYKRLGPNPTTNDMMLKVLANKKMWRQCEKCQHVIELVEGCFHVTCRYIIISLNKYSQSSFHFSP